MDNKKILITGASSGLGKALAAWGDTLNAELCLLSKSTEKLTNLSLHNANRHKRYAVDFTSEHTLDDVLSDLLSQSFIPDVIIHCAGGGFKMWNPLLTRKEFQQLLDVNLTAIIQINSRFAPLLMERKSGVLIHIGSTASTAAHGSVGYNTVKAALAAYVRSLGKMLGETGIVVTGLSPGSFIAEGNNMFHFQKEKTAEFNDYAQRLPTKRLITVSEFFPIIQMLCTQQGSLFNGCMLPVDAGEGMGYTY